MKGGFTVKKKASAFQKHKALEEEKKKKADEEAAKVYEDFVESFKADEDTRGKGGPPGVKTFLRGGTVMPGQSADTGGNTGSTTKKGQKYVPSFLPPSTTGAKKPSIFDDDDEDDESVFKMPAKKPAKEKARNIDTMLERLKKEQEAREERTKCGLPPDEPFPDPFAHNPNAFDDGNPYTTNLYVGNIAPDVDEGMLMKEFGRYGDIGSVKVMWPRDEEQRRKGRNCGFVAFMTREGADKAMTALSGLLLHDYELQIGWGKAIQIPDAAIYRTPVEQLSPEPPLVTNTRSERAFSAANVAVAGAAPGAAPAVVTASFAMPWAPETETAGHIIGTVHQGVGPNIEVQIPSDPRERYTIDTLALYIYQDGCAFEQIVMELEQNNPDFQFLFDLKSPSHAYYRWRLYSLAEGDTLRTWRGEPFVMVEGGQRWLPPAMQTHKETSLPQTTAAQRGGEGPKERDRQLNDSERDRFEDMLRSIKVERGDICEAMMFALENADAAGEVVEILAEALTLPETPVPTKIARLFLVSDILHNSTAPVRNASRYRARLEAALPSIFESLQDTYRHVETRMTQEFLRRYVLRVLRVWRERFLFSDDYLNGLQATFLSALMSKAVSSLRQAEGEGGEEGAGVDAAAAAAAAAAAQDAAPIGRPEMRTELEALGHDELERRCRQSGLAARDGPPAMVARLLALDLYLNPLSSTDGPGPESTPGLQLEAPSAAPGCGPGPREVGPSAGPPGPPEIGDGAGGEAIAGPAPAPAPKPILPLSRWTIIDEEEEKQTGPAVPISKWLEEQQQEQAELLRLQAAAEASAAALAADRIFDDTDDDDNDDLQRAKDDSPGSTPPMQPSFGGKRASGGGGGGHSAAGGGGGASAAAVPAAANPAVDEERRKRLREIELQCARLEAELEDDETLASVMIGVKVQELREQLLAELERADSGAAAGGGDGGKEKDSKADALERWKNRRNSSSEKRARSRSRSRSLERQSSRGDPKDSSSRDRRSTKDRERDKDKEDSKHRKRSRSQDKVKDAHRSSSRGSPGHRSGSRGDKEREREKPSKSSKHRSRSKSPKHERKSRR